MEIDPVFYEEAVGRLREIENIILVHGDATAAIASERFDTVVVTRWSISKMTSR